jgi:hypothetical protein
MIRRGDAQSGLRVIRPERPNIVHKNVLKPQCGMLEVEIQRRTAAPIANGLSDQTCGKSGLGGRSGPASCS